MPQTIIGLKNIASPAAIVTIRDLNDCSVPIGGTIEVSDTNSYGMIRWSKELYTAIENDEILIVIDGVEQSKVDSANYMHDTSVVGGVGETASSLIGETTNDTPLVLGNLITVENNTLVVFEVTVLGVEPITGNSWVRKIKGSIKNKDGVTSLADGNTVTTIGESLGALLWSASAIANDVADSLEITVNGENGKTIKWKAVSVSNKIKLT